jgi:putative nucleotidyltransferase-like protein
MPESLNQRSLAELIAQALSGSWRSAVDTPDMSPADLAAIVHLLVQSGAGALVWRRIRGSALAATDAAAQLQQHYRLHRLEASLHVRRIKRVVRQLRAAGIDPVLVKGWNVARLYPEPGLRQYYDVDLCVAHDVHARASSLVASSEEDASYVDLHDELDHLDVMRWEDFFARTQLVKVEDLDVRVPCAEDHLRILCIHWLRHGAWRPAGLCDVAAAIESLPDEFDWQRCLGPDPVRANWVACTIKLAQELLGAKGKGQRAEGKEQRAKGKEQRAEGEGSATALPLALSSLPFARLPRWLAPAVLRQWSRSLSPNFREPALPSLLGRLTVWKELTRDLYSRLDQPVRATVALRGRFNNWPRLPYQLGELLLHSAEAPKQLGMMMRELVAAKEFNSSIQRNSLDKSVPQTIPDGI